MIKVKFSDGEELEYPEDSSVPLVTATHHRPKDGYDPVSGNPSLFVKWFSRKANVLFKGHQLCFGGELKTIAAVER